MVKNKEELINQTIQLYAKDQSNNDEDWTVDFMHTAIQCEIIDKKEVIKENGDIADAVVMSVTIDSSQITSSTQIDVTVKHGVQQKIPIWVTYLPIH